MKKIKLLLYCCKHPLYLVRNECDGHFYTMDKGTLDCYKNVETYNGKIVAECDFEVEKITAKNIAKYEKESCVDRVSTFKYLKPNVIWASSFEIMLSSFGSLTLGYAIHIKNLNIFDKPKYLQNYVKKAKNRTYWMLDKAPQNMMVCYKQNKEKYILISIRPEHLVKILNGEKKIEVRKKVLKEMIS